MNAILKKAEHAYWLAVYAAADDIRTRIVIPYCERTGMRFKAGMGSWSFDHPTKGYQFNEDAPKYVREPLGDELLSRQDIGSVILDYTPKGYTK